MQADKDPDGSGINSTMPAEYPDHGTKFLPDNLRNR